MNASQGYGVVEPDDEFNRLLVEKVHPPGWVNPQPKNEYHLVVIGAGTAGLVTAAGAAGLGARVALVERHLMGGDCLNVGCVPSKSLLSAARMAATVRQAGEYGVAVPEGAVVDFGRVMQRLRRVRAGISANDSAERFRGLGVDVFLGSAQFGADGRTVVVGDRSLKFRKAVVCTGARAAVPDIPGLAESGYLTNETIFSLTELPRRLAIIGGGPIGVEMAQAFARFGSEVVLFQRRDRILPHDDAEAAGVVEAQLRREGVSFHYGCVIREVRRSAAGTHITAVQHEKVRDWTCDAVLVAAGRAPNVAGLNLEGVGVAYDLKGGVRVDDRLRTSNPRIFAAGDVCSQHKFTHTADFLARIVIQNALFFGRAKASSLIVPWCTYTSPELAHVGLGVAEAAAQGIAVDTLVQPFDEVDRAILDGETTGFVKVHLRRGTDRIVGATIVGSYAGDLISEISVAMRNKVGLRGIGGTIHPYPTRADAIRKLGDQYNRKRLKPGVKWVLRRLMEWGAGRSG